MKITKMKRVQANSQRVANRKVMAADNVFEDEEAFSTPDLDDTTTEDLEEDMGEDGKQDGTTIEIENNIANHLIAECENCHGIFISAMIASDQPVESINGVCPLCNKDTEQALRWIIKDYPEEE
ncbi:MAG: hypothetical protein J5725_04275 [Bacteroidales bacterium]|nr:hypothetical protein [Bacteroidales bacterium]